jgi:putative membrane protein
MGFGWWGIPGMILLWIGLVFLAVWLVRVIFASPRSPDSHANRPPTAREILDQRYARGEISREQYELMKKDIS